MAKTIYYNSIPAEIKRIGLTQAKCSTYLGCSLSGLTHRIKADRQQLHWAVYGLGHYLGAEENLQHNVEE